METSARLNVAFAPRRLGHVNLWVSDLERAIEFYETVCGLELVRRERDLSIAFHSNGNTHHDIGMVETSRGVDRYGRDGTLQIPKTRGTSVGLNHLGWEMESEAHLVRAYKRAAQAGFPIQRAVDHLISHSVYVSDPDGNGHEFYADEMQDWRAIYNLDKEDEVTGLWDPLAALPKHEANYNIDPPIRRVDRAPLHPSHLTGARFATRRFGPMVDFFVSVGGLKVLQRLELPRPTVQLAGTTGRVDLTLYEASGDELLGLRGFKLRLNELVDVSRAARSLIDAGVDASIRQGDLVLRDPDGFEVEFHQAPA